MGLKQSSPNDEAWSQNKKLQVTIYDELQGTGIPCMRCVSHTGYLAHGNSKGEAKERIMCQNNSKRVVWNVEGRNKDTTREQSPKQGQTSAKDLTNDADAIITIVLL